MRPFPSMANSTSLATDPLSHQAAEAVFHHLTSKSWQINCAVLLSMTLQVVLAFGGTFRHSSSNTILKLMLWLAYMSADAVAIYALGNMAKQHLSVLFGIFAPLLLLHLGGPDTISAYSTADNELWKRHMLNMIIQTLVAMYVIYVSGLKERLLAAAILLAFVGTTKYAERTLALRCASFSQIVSSAKPTYKYMSCGAGQGCKYMVMGVTEWDKEFEERTATKKKQKVSIHEIWKEEGKKAPDNYMLCLSYALFKMYKRRYVNLYLHERGDSITRKFFLGEDISQDIFEVSEMELKFLGEDMSQDISQDIPSLTSDQVFVVLEMELKFLYDALFTKSSSTAYSKLGVAMRLVNFCTLGIAGYIVLNELGGNSELFNEALPAQRTVAYIVVCVGFIVEFFQLIRIIASDWTLVWMICKNICNKKNKYAKLMKFVIAVLSKVRQWRRRQYWKKTIQQYCIIDTCSQISPLIWRWSSYFHATDLLLKRYIRRYIRTAPVEKNLKKFILEQVKRKCLPEYKFEACKTELPNFKSSLKNEFLWASEQDHEHLILQWHVATTICEMEYRKLHNPNTNKNEKVQKCLLIKRYKPTTLSQEEPSKCNDPNTNQKGNETINYLGISRSLSRYCAYLLVSCPKLLPLHPDIAKMEYMDLHNQLIVFYQSNEGDLKSLEKNSTLGKGAKLARQLLKEEQRWEIIAHHWTDVLIYYATLSKSTLHAETLTVGGEFVTLLWVLIGHLGCGE